MPTVYIIAGPNGAGKTTFSREFLSKFVAPCEFLNADLIAAGLSPFNPETQNIRAGRLLLERIDECIAERVDFAIETTLSGRSYALQIQNMRKAGYHIVLMFLWLPSADLAVTRVATRVRQGGHSVPEREIRRRWEAGLRNLTSLYRPLVHEWVILDATRVPQQVIAQGAGEIAEIVNHAAYKSVTIYCKTPTVSSSDR